MLVIIMTFMMVIYLNFQIIIIFFALNPLYNVSKTLLFLFLACLFVLLIRNVHQHLLGLFTDRSVADRSDVSALALSDDLDILFRPVHRHWHGRLNPGDIACGSNLHADLPPKLASC